MAEPAARVWVRCRLVAGHGVASGRAASSPYPAGTIALQRPYFAAAGIDLSHLHPATLNLDVAPLEWRLAAADARVEHLRWTDLHPPETFSFWHCWLRRPSPSPADAAIEAMLYHPHPQTKRAHHQSAGCVEVLAPWIEGLQPGQSLELGVDPRRCRLVDPRRLRARLLEFLKFRVLAAQAEFFHAFEAAGQPGESTLDAERLRVWLAPLWSEALDLSDHDLSATFEQARRLYGS